METYQKRRQQMTEAQKWSQERNFNLFQLRGVIGIVDSWKYSFCGEIGIGYLKPIELSLKVLLHDLKYFDSYAKVLEMRRRKEEIGT